MGSRSPIFFAALVFAATSMARAADAPQARQQPAAPASDRGPVRVTGCEHFAFLRPSLAGGLGGPQREALKSWEGERSGGFGPDGSYYQIDQNNSIVFRIKDGQARVFAGDGVRGGRDGPADQARFDFGVGSYSDADVACDATGSVYVSEGQAGRLRKISRGDGGFWTVTTVSGGGTRMPKMGETIPAVMYTCGGDESVPRRIEGGRVMSLYRDGVFRPHVPVGAESMTRN